MSTDDDLRYAFSGSLLGFWQGFMQVAIQQYSLHVGAEKTGIWLSGVLYPATKGHAGIIFRNQEARQKRPNRIYRSGLEVFSLQLTVLL